MPRTAQQFVDLRSASPPSPSVPPRCDQPTHRISNVSPNSPDRALRFTAIRASERFWGLKEGRGAVFRAVRPAPPIRHHKRESAKRPSRCLARGDSATPSVNEKARLDFEAGLVSLPSSPDGTDPNFRWRSDRARGGEDPFPRNGREGPDRNVGAKSAKPTTPQTHRSRSGHPRNPRPRIRFPQDPRAHAKDPFRSGVPRGAPGFPKAPPHQPNRT